MHIHSFIRKALVIPFFLLLRSNGEAAPASGPLQPLPLGRLIDVGGYHVHLYCTGSGSPTVMVVGGGFSFDWGLVQPKVAEFTRICTYDPSGTTWSDPFRVTTKRNPGSEPSGRTPTCSERVEEIHNLLKNAAISGPYVIVGFSIGGLFARLYANNYPQEVAGMVLVDHAFINPGGKSRPGVISSPNSLAPSGETEDPLSVTQVDSPPVLISKVPIILGIEDDQNFRKLQQHDQDLHIWAMSRHPIRPTAAAAAECIAVVENATRDRSHPLGDIPLIVISINNDSPNYENLQRKLLLLSHDSQQIVAENSSHMVIVDQPEVIISGVRQIVTAVRNHARLQK